MREPCVYLLASHFQGTLYCGVTSDLIGRVWQHRNDVVPGFANRYGVHQLAWFEQHATMEYAIAREKAIKEWKRAWKIRLIERGNPAWRDLYPGLLGTSWKSWVPAFAGTTTSGQGMAALSGAC